MCGVEGLAGNWVRLSWSPFSTLAVHTKADSSQLAFLHAHLVSTAIESSFQLSPPA